MACHAKMFSEKKEKEKMHFVKKTIPVIVFLLLAQTAVAENKEVYKVTALDAKPPYHLSIDELDEALGVVPEAERPKDYVRVIYFHIVPGCDICQVMSKNVFQTLTASFKEELKTKRVILRYYDMEDEKNAKIVQAFDVKGPSLYIVQGAGGKDVKAKNADQIWSLVTTKKKFLEYVEKEVRDYLSEETAPAKEQP